MPELPNPKPRPHPHARPEVASGAPIARIGGGRPRHAYAELQVTSNFTFLTGGSHPEEYVEQAAALGHRAVAITDCNTVAGIVRAHVAAKRTGMPYVVGARVQLSARNELTNPPCRSLPAVAGASVPSCLSVLLYPTSARAYAHLCRLLTIGKRRAPKGECQLDLHDLLEHHGGLLAVAIPPRTLDQHFVEVMEGLRRTFDDDRLSLAATCRYDQDDRDRLAQVTALADHVRVPLVATNDVHYHVPERRALQDVLTCIRHGCTLEQAGFRLFPHAERHLKPAEEMARLFADRPRALARTIEIAERAGGFSLDELRYQYPHEICPPGVTPMEHLRALTRQGAAERYEGDVPADVLRRIEHEFRLIEELNYAPYFLTVHDLVVYARSRGILCQGRGAAANSAVCYCLGVTSVDPDRIDLLFERFISRERNEPPDIDIDFEHERREEVIQYIYGKYGRDRAALTAEVISYRGRSAVREVGKALGLSLDCVDRMAKDIDWWSDRTIRRDLVRQLGLDPDEPTIRRVLTLSEEVIGFPRHLSQHVGGFVITRGPLCEMVPVENAAMPDRTVIEWDKDDIDAMGMLKVDCLGLGMLTCISKAFGMVNSRHEGTEARRHEGVSTGVNKGVRDEQFDQDIPGSDCVAEINGAGQVDLLLHEVAARRREVRIDQPDAPRGGLRSPEHRRGIRTTELEGLPEVPAHGPRIAGRIVDPAGAGRRTRHASPGRHRERTDRRNGSRPPGIDPQPATEASVNPNRQSNTPSCLRASVPPCLPLQLHTIPPEDPLVYDMICEADTIGVFQIESRAQMTMLPRLRPRCFYDLVIEVAIVRPGPIQGDMVHPFLRRRTGEEAVTYPSPDVRRVLARTLGVPLFQEQVMSLAVVAAGFTPGEADELRRSMAAWKRRGDQLDRFEKKFIDGMLARNYERDFAERCFNQIRGFSEYGFPESHAASFALIVYVSAWLKKYHPAAFAAALINSQPMGFYAPAQIVRDAEAHGVEVRPIDVNCSGWDCSLEEARRHGGTEARSGVPCFPPPLQGGGQGVGERSSPSVPSCLRAFVPPALRLGLRLVKGLREDDGRAIEAAVEHHGPFDSIESLWRASRVPVATLRRLARADAFRSMGLDRQRALWQVQALRDDPLPLFERTRATSNEEGEALPAVSAVRAVMHDYRATALSLKAHPVSFTRDLLQRKGVTPAAELADEARWPHGRRIAVAGLSLVRQRPATASGVVFITLEDETGIANLIIRPKVFERCRRAARHGILLLARGTVERQGQVVHVMTHTIETLDEHMRDLVARSRDFH